MRAKKKDSNHNEIALYFESEGMQVSDTSVMGRDFPDMIIHNPVNLKAVFIEAKSKYGTQTDGQKKWAANSDIPVFVVRNTLEARHIIEILKS